MTLAQLKERLIVPGRTEYQFDPGHYRGQHEMLMEHITVQEMRMESGSQLIIFSLTLREWQWSDRSPTLKIPCQ